MITFATLSGRFGSLPAPALCPRPGQSGQRRSWEDNTHGRRPLLHCAYIMRAWRRGVLILGWAPGRYFSVEKDS